MKKDFGFESYTYNQLLHEQMLFMSMETSFFFLNKRRPNEPIFFHHSTQKQDVQQHQSCNL
jgi:hypothetical protein